MKHMRARRPSAAMVVALIALVVAASGTAIAAGGLVRGDKLIARNSLSGNRLRNHTVGPAQLNVTRLGTVPSARIAGHAMSAATATSAVNATDAVNATSAVNAMTATTATNALSLGGTAASAFQKGCSPGAVAAVARWFVSSLPTDGTTYVSPDRVGGEAGFACAGSGLTATSLGTGLIRVKVNGLTGNNVFALVNADPNGNSPPLAAYVAGPFAGGVYDVHVANGAGTATDPYYLTVAFVIVN
jgi:hypothetical protein